MRNAIVAIDVDDTVLSLVENWLRIYNKDFDDTLKKEDITDWDISKFVKPEAKNTIYTYMNKPRVFRTAKPIPNALDIINKFRKRNVRIIYVTANDVQDAKFKWLMKYGFVYDRQDYVVAYDKSLIKADALIDDKPDNIFGFDGYGILMSQPWNAHIQYEGRVNNWLDLAQKIMP